MVLNIQKNWQRIYAAVVKRVLRAAQLYKSFFCEEILVLGDSHVNVFYNIMLEHKFTGKYFNVVSVGGATVSGLENPHSITQAMPIFQRKIKKSKAKLCIVSLGEVDTGFVIWYRSEKNNASVEKMMNAAIMNYTSFLETLSNTFQVICISTPLPTIRDKQNWGKIANARKYVKATQKQRTDLTLRFNQIIGNFCGEKGILFVSLDEKSLDKNGTLKKELFHNNPNDHHYNSKTYSKMLIKELQKLIEPDI